MKISSQISSQNYSKQVETARQEDQAEINAALKQLLEKQDSLLALVGQPDTDIIASHGNDINSEDNNTSSPATQATIFGLLGDIQDVRALEMHLSSDADLFSVCQTCYQQYRARRNASRSPCGVAEGCGATSTTFCRP
jgi:hypothetical protein